MSEIVLTGIVEDRSEPGCVKFNASGEGHAIALVHAVVANYPTPGTIEDILTAFVGQKVTLLRHSSTMLGAPVIALEEGTLFIGNNSGKVCLLPKGKRKNGHVLDPGTVLDILKGYGQGDHLRLVVQNVVDSLPALAPLTQADLDLLPTDAVDDEGNTSDCTLAVFGTLPWFGGTAIPGAIWLICGYDAENDIVDGVLLVPDGHDAFSEHGTCYGRDLLRRSNGRIRNFDPMTFREALDLCDASYGHKLAAVTGVNVERILA